MGDVLDFRSALLTPRRKASITPEAANALLMATYAHPIPYDSIIMPASGGMAIPTPVAAAAVAAVAFSMFRRPTTSSTSAEREGTLNDITVPSMNETRRTCQRCICSVNMSAAIAAAVLA